MFPLILSLITALGLPQDGARPVPKTQGTNEGASKQGPAPAKPDVVDPWDALRKSIEQRLDKDAKRLEKVLEPYLSDLALDTRDEKNRKYLEPRYREIAALDPDIGLVLLPLLSRAPKNRRDRFLAQNSVRVLELTNLAPLEGDLLSIVEKDKGQARNRALYLLTGFKKTGLDETLKTLLEKTPEILLPGVIEAVGRYGHLSLAPNLEPFLLKPDERQRQAAFEALCRLGSVKSLGPLVTSAKVTSKALDRKRLIAFLGTLGSREGQGGWNAEPAAFFETLVWLLNQGEALRPGELTDLLSLIQRLPAEAVTKHGGDKLQSALDRLLTNPYADVQFGAALAMRHLGDKKGVKQVLDRLSRFIKNNSKISYGYRERGRANEAFGEISDALRDYKKAISFSPGRVDPSLYFAVARLETKKGNASAVYRNLKDAQATPQELARFRQQLPEVEVLIRRSNQLRKLFED